MSFFILTILLFPGLVSAQIRGHLVGNDTILEISEPAKQLTMSEFQLPRRIPGSRNFEEFGIKMRCSDSTCVLHIPSPAISVSRVSGTLYIYYTRSGEYATPGILERTVSFDASESFPKPARMGSLRVEDSIHATSTEYHPKKKNTHDNIVPVEKLADGLRVFGQIRNIFTLDNPSRIIFDFDTAYSGRTLHYEINGEIARVGSFRGRLRMVIDRRYPEIPIPRFYTDYVVFSNK